MIKIAPSILSADFAKMGEEARRMELAGADLLHCDVMDGVFVPNISFGPKMIKDIRKITDITLDVHLMITEPIRYVKAFAEAGADIITAHVEATDDIVETLRAIKSFGCKCGAVINPGTPVSALEGLIEQCDIVLLMGVNPGFGGQAFIPEVLSKLRAVKKTVKESCKNIDIEIDGGVTLKNVKDIRAAGANVIVAGSAIFDGDDKRAAITALRGLN